MRTSIEDSEIPSGIQVQLRAPVSRKSESAASIDGMPAFASTLR
jgi:hypothetical protein